MTSNIKWAPEQWRVFTKVSNQLGATQEQKREARARMNDDNFIPSFSKYGLVHWYVKQVIQCDEQYLASDELIRSESGSATLDALDNNPTGTPKDNTAKLSRMAANLEGQW